MSKFRSILFVTFAAILILAFAPQAWDTLERGWYWLFPVERPSTAVTLAEHLKELAAKGLRDQLVTFGNIESIDGSKYELFALGVGQMTLKKPETNVDELLNTLPQVQPSLGRDYRSNSPLTTVTGQQIKDAELEASRPQMVTGDFNNILIFDRKANTFTPIFDKRAAISRFQTGWRTPQDILIIFGTDSDSNHDGTLGYGDLTDLFIYTFADKQLHRIATPGLSASYTFDIPNSDYLIVQYQVDRNHDGKITSYYDDAGEEPSTLMRIDLKTYEAKPFVPDEIVHKLQTTLETPVPPEPQPVEPAKP